MPSVFPQIAKLLARMGCMHVFILELACWCGCRVLLQGAAVRLACRCRVLCCCQGGVCALELVFGVLSDCCAVWRWPAGAAAQCHKIRKVLLQGVRVARALWSWRSSCENMKTIKNIGSFDGQKLEIWIRNGL